MQKEIKVQTNLDNFFIYKSSNSSSTLTSKLNSINTIKKYFYLQWTNEFRPDEQAIWLDKKPDKINFIQEIQSNYVYSGYVFYLCGNFKDYDEPIYYLSKEEKYKDLFFLKSHLQKSIRKQDESLSVRTAYHLLKLDEVELLRRISIIMIEDVKLHESYSTIIWLLVALSNNKKSKSFNSSKFRMKKYIYEWLLGLIYTLTKINSINNLNNLNNLNSLNSLNSLNKINYLSEEIKKENKSIVQLFNSYNQFSKEVNSLLYSIHIRISFGGFDGEMIMLKNFAEFVNNNNNNNIHNINININNIIDNTHIKLIKIYVKELEKDELDFTAIDYHCNSNFLEYLTKKYPDIEPEELKKIIWNHSSNINYRISKTSEYNIEKWNKIKDYVEKTQKYLLNHL
jgi:hypothetical protein